MPATTTAGELCEASAFLPPALRTEVLQTYPTADRRLIADELVCALGAHSSDEHYAVVYDHFPPEVPGALWARWRHGTEPDAVQLRPDCPALSPDRTACGHFATHPGPHTWESDEPRPGRGPVLTAAPDEG